MGNSPQIAYSSSTPRLSEENEVEVESSSDESDDPEYLELREREAIVDKHERVSRIMEFVALIFTKLTGSRPEGCGSVGESRL